MWCRGKPDWQKVHKLWGAHRSPMVVSIVSKYHICVFIKEKENKTQGRKKGGREKRIEGRKEIKQGKKKGRTEEEKQKEGGSVRKRERERQRKTDTHEIYDSYVIIIDVRT